MAHNATIKNGVNIQYLALAQAVCRPRLTAEARVWSQVSAVHVWIVVNEMAVGKFVSEDLSIHPPLSLHSRIWQCRYTDTLLLTFTEVSYCCTFCIVQSTDVTSKWMVCASFKVLTAVLLKIQGVCVVKLHCPDVSKEVNMTLAGPCIITQCK